MTGPESSEDVSVATMDVDACTDSRWSELVSAHRSDVFHAPAWARVLRDSYDFPVRARLLTDPGGHTVAGMAYVPVEDIRGRRLVSLPFSDFCDPLSTDPPGLAALADSLLATGERAQMRCLRTPVEMLGEHWEETGTLAWHRVDASRSADEMWESLHPSGRRAIRRARSAGLEVTEAATEKDLRDFFEMHLRVRKHKYGLLAQPYRFFEAIWQHFLSVGEGRLLLARLGSDLIGGVLYLKWKDTLYYKFNASDSSNLEVRPNDLLVWEGLCHAREQGLDWFDFGVSDRDQEGLVRYKRKYATEEGEVRKYSAGPSSPDPLGPLLGELTGLLSDPAVPDSITERAGDSLYHLFS